jgi:calcineurin-like phosphoesterase
MTDVGMTGPFDSVIGVQKEMILQRFLTSMTGRFEAAHGDVKLCAAVIDCDAATGRATAIERVMIAQNAATPVEAGRK